MPSDLPALAAAFLLVIGFTFSDDVVEFLPDVTGHPHSRRPRLAGSRSISLLVLGTAAPKWAISGGGDLPSFLRRLCTGNVGRGRGAGGRRPSS